MINRNNRSIVILFFTMVVVMMGFGIVLPVLPFYIKSFGATGRSLGMLIAAYSVMQFVFAPVWGVLSDRYGRKPILIIGVTGNALSHFLFALSDQLWMLFAARAMAGILSSATLPTAMAYIGDTTTAEKRGGGMGMISAAIGVGVVIGPGFGGWLAVSSLSLPFFVAAGVSALAMLPILFFLPESLSLKDRCRSQKSLDQLRPQTFIRALSGPIGFLLVLAFLVSFGLTNFEGIFGLFALDKFGYGTGRVGTILVFVGVMTSVMQGGLTGPLTRRFGEQKIILVSLLLSGAGFLLMLKAVSFIGVIVTVSLFIIGNALLRPAVSAMISKRAVSGQGQAMGLNNSFMSLGRIAGPACAGFLYDMDMSFPYISGALVMFLAFAATFVWLSRNRLENTFITSEISKPGDNQAV